MLGSRLRGNRLPRRRHVGLILFVLAASSSVSLLAEGGARVSVSAAKAQPPLVVLIGDSTTLGYSETGGYVRWEGEPALGSLRILATAGSRWRRMRVVNLAVGGTTTGDWAVRVELCPGSVRPARAGPAWMRLLAFACAKKVSLASAVRAVLGRDPTVALVVLGTNDPLRRPDATPEEAVRNLERIAAILAPARVLIASPFWTRDARRAPFVEQLAALLRRRHMLSGPDFARMRLPLGPQGVHLTRGSYIAAAGFWLDRLVREEP